MLVIEDDEEIRAQMDWALCHDYVVFQAGDRSKAIEVFLKEQPAVVTLDLGLPPHPNEAVEGLAVLEEVLEKDALAKVIVITGNSDRANALAAIERGAYDFLEKPVQVGILNVVIQRAAHVYRLETENRALQSRTGGEGFNDIIGASPPMQQVFETIRRVAATEIPVLVVGESGTGKELVARAIHGESARKNGPFIPINCGAVPENLIESELFGHEKGSFTGAHIQRKGLIESAQRGTLFLDEIGELPLPLQVKLLRFLQEQCIERVGGRVPIDVDARVIAATNIDLKHAVKNENFRDDLYYRLEGVTLTLPPLRERGSDIMLLAKAILEQSAQENEKKVHRFTRQAMAAIGSYHWPGNVRELKNRIERAVIMAKGRSLTAEDLEFSSAYAKYEGRTLKDARDGVEKEMIEWMLTKYRNNVSRAATSLGVSRPTLHQLLLKHGIVITR